MRMHGGDRTSYETEYGSQPLDFSANVSPLGVPSTVRQAVLSALDDAAHYPDPACRALRSAIGETLGVSADRILCGNGASDLIWRLAAAVRPNETLVTAPAFGEYEAAVRANGGRILYHRLKEENGFRVTEEILSQIREGVGLLFLCQPNNPTGVTVERDLLLRILGRCRQTGTLLVTDECFLGFVQDPDSMTMLPYLDEGNLLILRAFTKLYAVAGLRLGYCLCRDTDLLRRMALAGPPWAVSNVAQAAGIAALRDAVYAQKVRSLIERERPVLQKGLEGLGMRVVPGEANFLLFSSSVPLEDELKKRGILIRCCGDFEGLGPLWYRTAVRTGEENGRLLAALREVLS